MDLGAAVSATSVAVDGVAGVCVDHCDVSVLRAELKRLKTTQSRLDAQVARLTHAADAEKDCQELWRRYFSAVNISQRDNPRLHLSQLPRRFWRYLPEKQGC